MIVTLKWSKALSVGNNKIDQQHKKLFSIINDLINIHQQNMTCLTEWALYPLLLIRCWDHIPFSTLHVPRLHPNVCAITINYHFSIQNYF